MMKAPIIPARHIRPTSQPEKRRPAPAKARGGRCWMLLAVHVLALVKLIHP